MMTQKQIYAAIDRFLADEGRVVSEKNFCTIAGISYELFKQMFKYKTAPMSVTSQLRLEKALGSLERGEIKVMRNPDQRTVAGYRRKPEPEFSKGYGLTIKNGRIAVKCAPVNVNDYTAPTFKQKLGVKWPS